MKKPLQSKTIQTGVGLMATAVTSLVLHYTGTLELGAPALGAAWSTIVSSALMIALRLVTKEPVGLAESQDSAEETE
jgi:hypothetical protein